MRYEIVYGFNNFDLQKKVNEKLAAGWELYGNLTVANVWTKGDSAPGDRPREQTLFFQTVINNDSATQD